LKWIGQHKGDLNPSCIVSLRVPILLILFPSASPLLLMHCPSLFFVIIFS
jgi:hypothetical protein